MIKGRKNANRMDTQDVWANGAVKCTPSAYLTAARSQVKQKDFDYAHSNGVNMLNHAVRKADEVEQAAIMMPLFGMKKFDDGTTLISIFGRVFLHNPAGTRW